MKNEPIIQVEHLTKTYGALKAVDDISFEVRKGELFAFLGPNGAGKSTTIKILTTLLQQDSGTVLLNGNNNNVYIRSKIGVVFQENVLDNLLTVKENLMYMGKLYLPNSQEVLNRYEELKNTLQFAEFENKQFRHLSGGQKRKVEIARALLGNPEVLFLDEPTTGLDPETRKTVWQTIKNLQKQKNITVFLTTHYMEEANDADYVVIINKGKIYASGTPSNLKNTYAKDILKVQPHQPEKLEEYVLKNELSFNKVADNYVFKNLNLATTIELLSKNQTNIKSFENIKGTMDDVFLTVVEEKLL